MTRPKRVAAATTSVCACCPPTKPPPKRSRPDPVEVVLEPGPSRTSSTAPGLINKNRKRQRNSQNKHMGSREPGASRDSVPVLPAPTHVGQQRVTAPLDSDISCNTQTTNRPEHTNQTPVLPVLTTQETLPRDEEESDSSVESSLSEDEAPQSFAAAVNNFTDSLLATGGGMQYAEPISTSISVQIPKSIKKKIWANKFIDFTLLLPNSETSPNTIFTFQVDRHSNFNIVPSTKSKKITSIETWTTAFLRFVAVYLEKFPHEGPHLMKYGEIIRDLALKRPGFAWSTYDRQFRQLRESLLMPWDRVHTEFWIMATTLTPVIQHSFRPSSFRTDRQHGSFRPNPFKRKQHSKFLENTCWTFNRRGMCSNSSCIHPHVCGFCRGPHSANACPQNVKQQTTSTPTSSKPSQPSSHRK